jgi:hypothetical protein
VNFLKIYFQITFCILILFLASIYPQDLEKTSPKRNIVFIEGGGSGLLFSLNYERFLNQNISIRAGFGTGGVILTSYPILVNYYIGDEKKLELGLGMIYVNNYTENSLLGKPGSLIITSTIGHSYHPASGGITIRFSFTPMYILKTKRMVPYAGISAGFNF